MIGARIGARRLLAWTLLTAAIHGAGLMLVALLSVSGAHDPATAGASLAFLCPIPRSTAGVALIGGIAMVGAHVVAMLGGMGALALARSRWHTAWPVAGSRFDAPRIWAALRRPGGRRGFERTPGAMGTPILRA